MAAPKICSLFSAALLSLGGVAGAETEVLFEDTFTGTDGTVLATGSAETYQIVGRTNAVMTPTIESDQLALSIGPNANDGGNTFSVLHQNTRFDFMNRPLLFETDVDLGDAVTVAFGIHSWLGNNRIDASANYLIVTYYTSGNRLLLTGKNGGTTIEARYEIPEVPNPQFRLGIYLDGTEVKMLIDGAVVYTEAHNLSPTAFADGGYMGLQLYGGGAGTTHTAYFDNLRVVAEPDLTPQPTVMLSDTFDGADGEISLTDPSPYRTATRDGVVMGVYREDEQLKVTMDNTNWENNFSMLHHNVPLRFDQTPLLFEVDVDPGDMNTVAIGLHDWLGNNSLLYGDNVSATVYGDGRMIFGTRNAGATTDARYESPVGAFTDRTFRLGIYLDETDAKFFIDGELLYDGPHYLDQSLLDDGVYFGIQLNGGAFGGQAAYFDNLQVTANPDLSAYDVLPGDVFWSTATAIRSLHFESGQVQTVVPNLGRPIGVAVDHDAEHVYWIEHDTGVLMRADTNGENVTELRSDINTGQFLALDAVADNLYWAEWTEGLYSSPLDGSARDLLVSDPDNGNAGVALTDDRAFLLSAASGAVTGYNLDGTGSPETVTTFAGQTYAIAVDPSAQEMFASNFSEGWIKAYDLNTETMRTVWDSDLDKPLGVAVSSDGEQIYWVERTNGRIRVANADGSGTITTLVMGEDSPFGIAVRPLGGAPAGFAGWIDGFDLAEGEDGPQDDPAGDGVPNLLKYALGLNPTEPSRDALPQPVVSDLEGSQYLSMTVERNPDATGVTWVFEVSTDLVTWSSNEADVMVVEDGNSVTAWSTVAIDEGTRVFMRARVDVE